MMPATLDPAATVVLSWLLTYAIHSTILLSCAAIVARLLSDQHAWLESIWKAALIAPLLTASLNPEPLAPPVGARWSMARSSSADEATLQTSPSPAAPTTQAPRPRPQDPRATTQDSVPTIQDASLPTRDPGPRTQDALPLIIGLSWLTLASLAMLRYGWRLRGVYRALGAGAPVEAPDLIATLDALRSEAGERRPVRVTTSPLCRVPLALSGRRIVLPPQFLDALDPEQQRAALAHELAHVIRRDPEWRIAMEIMTRALFFQPLNRVARVRICDTAEFLCDEWAVRHTESPLALARCLTVVASWWAPADSFPAGVSPMVRSDSTMVRRVKRILDTPAVITRPRLLWLAIPVALVAVAAPRVTAKQLPLNIAAASAVTAVSGTTLLETTAEQRGTDRSWTAAEIAAARKQLRVYRLNQSGASLEDRWRQALADAGKQGINDFWIAYTFHTPTHAGNVMLHDTREGMNISSNGAIATEGVPLGDLTGSQAIPLEGGNVAVLLHYRGTRVDAIDRASYRSAQLNFDFGRTPVFWLGNAPEAESFARVQALFPQTRERKIQLFMIELASLHSDSNAVIPFLARLVEPSWPAEIRSEAAEGFDRHHDPRSVEILLKVARTDSDSMVRAEAAETIGEVQTPQSIPALVALVKESPDAAVRSEAAEGFGAQPAAQALPAIEQVIAETDHDEVLNEAVEAIGELGDPAALSLLVQIANTHPNPMAQQEAVETIGDLDTSGTVDALISIAWEHQTVDVQREAVETLGDRRDDRAALAAIERIAREHDREEVQAEALETLADSHEPLHPILLELALSGRSTLIRREAVEAIGEAVTKIGDAQLIDRAQTVVERAVFEDPDRSVQMEALEALEDFPSVRALPILRDVIARHPDSRVRREAEVQVRERQ